MMLSNLAPVGAVGSNASVDHIVIGGNMLRADRGSLPTGCAAPAD